MSIIEKFKDKAKQLKERNLMNEGATEAQIQEFEEIMNIKLPQVMRDFFLANNGGCFADNSWDEKEILDPEELDAILWNSNYFLSLEEIVDAYNFGKYSSMDFQEREDESGKRFIPIIQTSGQENLVWAATEEGSTEILDAFHEYSADEWEVLYNSFEDLLDAYMEQEGNIETIA